jgi:hypothetical protein
MHVYVQIHINELITMHVIFPGITNPNP